MLTRVYVEITNICNMRCSFCNGHRRPKGRMSREDFVRVLDRLEGHTQTVYYHLMGEPLLHPELPTFIKMATQQGFRSVITTNGTLVKQRGQALLDAGIHKISISLHSFEKSDAQAHQNYLQEVAEFADAAAKSGVVVVLRLWNRGCDEGKNDDALDFLCDAIDGEWKETTRGMRIRDKFYLEWGDRFQWPDQNAPIQGENFFCYGMRDHFGILCDGTVVPCCLDSEGSIALGNVFETDLSEILKSPRATAMAKGFEKHIATEDLCRRCGYAQRFV